MNEPKISVIMPAYNAAAYIEAAIRSVMAQTFGDWELIVVDDCSKDETVQVVTALAAEDGRIHLICRDENSGGAAVVRNQAIDVARGEYVAFLDSDDIWLPNKLERQLSVIGNHALCYTSYAIMDATGNQSRPDYIVPEKVTFESLLNENVIGCSTVLMRRELAKFETKYFHEDFILWLSVLRDGNTAIGCPEVLTKWRLIETSRSFNKFKAAKNRWRIYRNYLRLPLRKSVMAFCSYMFAGLRKYF